MVWLVKISSIVRRLGANLELASFYSKGVVKGQGKRLLKALSSAAKKARFFQIVTGRWKVARLDEFLFSKTPLGPGGKEYWFIQVASTSGDKTQLVLTFGRSFFGAWVNGRAGHGGKVAAVGWYFSGKKKVFVEDSVPLEAQKGSLKTRSFEFRGAFPHYELSAGRGTQLRFSKPASGVPFEALDASANSLGLGMLNIYLDARGTVGGKKFSGLAYLQKVVVTAPFLPWNWARLTFPDKSVLDFYAVRPESRDIGTYLFRSATYRLASGRTVKLGECRLRRLAGDRWLLEGKGVTAYLKTYASKPFLLKGRGEFHYDEYMVECTDFAYGNISKQSGIGLVEDAYGFLL